MIKIESKRGSTKTQIRIWEGGEESLRNIRIIKFFVIRIDSSSLFQVLELADDSQFWVMTEEKGKASFLRVSQDFHSKEKVG